MLNRYPLWKNLLILAILAFGVIYSLPNFYSEDPAVQISGARSSTEVGAQAETRIQAVLQANNITPKRIDDSGKGLLVRFNSDQDQRAAKELIQQQLGQDYVVALNLAENTPKWLKDMGAKPMKLGLDLRGGVHFLLEVDMPAAVKQRLEVAAGQARTELRQARLRYRQVIVENGALNIRMARAEQMSDAARVLSKALGNEYTSEIDEDSGTLTFSLTEVATREIENYAIKQNLTTLRNRVNELGVAEPLVQRQGRNRIVVELPGVQDTAAAKRVLGATANLEFRLAAKPGANPMETESFSFRDNPNRSATLERDIITTGNNVSSASVGFDENNQPQVNIRLDGQGGRLMSQATRHNVGRQMAVLFIEHKTRTRITTNAKGEKMESRVPYTERNIISLATIQSELGSSFRITGAGTVQEASELSLLLRAGALAAPIYFVEERTIGPSLGQKNIDQGILSVEIGLVAVVLFMLAWYRLFGIFANIGLFFNLTLLVALMSLMGATLTLPGIAGIVLTLGMAVDANVLINARIKEEHHRGMSPHSAIHAGYERAFATILDANLTTLLVALILFSIGTGPVKGFAVTLSLGILTSMFTALMVTRMQVNWTLGRRKLTRLPM
ncbi:protein-export membrane protein SecD [Terasakiispira papahanaumokuakeensis]|uniref:Protein translocase subunit SecD n=1 Tax=Terasakiispira papahanaumokuakeensis TaxID=197479 RepID=A0A1E2V5Z3_9GAMM|nr:protein translocase subunit SecD [Terasakiispira papahanaumokuakeensis]ODC02333.1 protein-export membrane protein SecD [Terasakiispira papahanaumokuakeensis]